MPRLDLNLNEINSLRQDLATLATQQSRIDTQLLQQAARIEDLKRQGAPQRTLAEAEVQRDQLLHDRAAVATQAADARRRVDAVANGWVLQRDPALLAQALDGGQPIALFPVRLETRYVRNNAALRIRVYPDVLHVVGHTAALTEREREGGMAYWQARFGPAATAADEAERVLRDLALVSGRSRAAWTVRVLTPDNAAAMGAPDTLPQFPDVPAIDARAKATEALLLPDRWCAIGYGPGRSEVFRVWGNRIPDALPMSPDLLQLGEQQEGLFDGERRWLVDFDAALANGMGIEVTQAQVGRGFSLAQQTLERLVVLGLEWSKDATQTAGELAELLAAQRDSRGIGFVAPGTPTNNTEGAPSGYSPVQESAAPPNADEAAAAAAQPQARDALELLTDALGLPEGGLAAEGIVNAHLSDQRTALHMVNALWRGSFGQYLNELWNPEYGDENTLFIKPRTLYALREHAMLHLRPGGPLPVLRVGNQPYGVLPVVGKGFTDAGAPALQQGIAKLLALLRPMWELASKNVPLMTDGNVDKAKDILQTAPWSQAAYYRDEDPLRACYKVSPYGPSKEMLLQKVYSLFGITDYYNAGVACRRFRPDPPYTPGYLAGVPWVLADAKDPKVEAGGFLPAGPQNYLAQMATALGGPAAQADALLKQYQGGPALLQALAAYSVDLEKHEAAQSYAGIGAGYVVLANAGAQAVAKTVSGATSTLLNIEPRVETEASFEVHTPRQLASVVLPAVTGTATLGQHVMQSIASQPLQSAEVHGGRATLAAGALLGAADKVAKPLRDISAVKASLAYLATRSVGELNTALRGTLDVFSYRLDAWYTARASRRLAQLRGKKASGVYVGGFGWVENLRPDDRPASEGHVLAPSLGQAATAAILRSGAVANREQGAFNINLDSIRTRRAQDILQGLTRDQPLAALYGYRIERGLRDATPPLGKLIWPLRQAYPWRPAGDLAAEEPQEAVAARDVVDAVALLAAWQAGAAAVRTRLAGVVVNGHQPFAGLPAAEQQAFEAVLADAIDLADAVSDLLMAEGVHQIVGGNFERAGAAMAVVDKQSLPIEPEVARTPRGGVAYSQRFAVLCPAAGPPGWPQDRRSRTEPALDAWLGHMLGAHTRYRFSARVMRGNAFDELPVQVGLEELGLSALAAVLAATALDAGTQAHQANTGFRAVLADQLAQRVDDMASVTGLDIQPEGPTAADLGLGAFEALCSTLRAVLDTLRPATRKDLVVPQDTIEKNLPDEGEYPGVDLAELQDRAAALLTDFVGLKDALAVSAGADDLLANLAALQDFMPTASWPPQVAAIDAPGADPATRDDRADAALPVLNALLQARLDSLVTPLQPAPGAGAISHGQQVQQAIGQIRALLGRDFPVLPKFRLGAYAPQFTTSLAAQDALTLNDPWQVTGWMTRLARVRGGLDRFAGALSAHEALVDFSTAGDFSVVQYPYREGQAWAALPEAWKEADGVAADLSQVPEELHEMLAGEAAGFKNFHRIKPSLALALHTPGGRAPVASDSVLAGFVCDEWQELIPDRFQTAGIAFHFDAPGARPPQNILLALPPQADQAHWEFDQVVDVLHEAWDLARLRAVRPRDLESGLGALLPGNYLPQNFTDDLPSVQLLEMSRRALRDSLRIVGSGKLVLALGKI
ncbi:MAG: hypothetical protein JWP29_886 [Rhodoferax sp.]|nr:hypothetical protein [Rhodoferax sp.]